MKEIDFLNALPCAARRKLKKIIYEKCVPTPNQRFAGNKRKIYNFIVHRFLKNSDCNSMYIFFVLRGVYTENREYFEKFEQIKPKENGL